MSDSQGEFMKNTNKMSTTTLVLGAVLTAIVIILQFVSMNLRFSTFSITLTLVPIVIGAATCGVGMGAWLGLVFGVIVLLTGDAAPFMAVNIAGTITTVLIKGVAAGFITGYVYRLIEKYNRYVAVGVAAVICPVVNTGVFLIGCKIFFMEAVASWAAAAGMGANVGVFMIVGLVGINFIIELGTNMVLAPIIVRLLKIKSK